MTELLIHCGEQGFQIVGTLFEERVVMQAGESGEARAVELFGGDAESRAGDAGVVDRRFAGRAFRVHAQAAEHFTTLQSRVGHDLFAEAEPLRERVEIQVVGELTQRLDVRCVVGGRIDDDVLLEIVASEQFGEFT